MRLSKAVYLTSVHNGLHSIKRCVELSNKFNNDCSQLKLETSEEDKQKHSELLANYNADVSRDIYYYHNDLANLAKYLEDIHQIYGSRLERNLWAFGGWFCGSFAAFLLVRYVFH
ncbi:hypothetical protein [Suttonella ornithocola]|uniref:Uncharacterized protein n=1 Tax=Suttonella ornithocola TaxID=279832 RepID=A0A380MNH6_9GAMM|nr:hypothetical protein [Suttonella ornithocola]SUO93453.1 Uncharacterised protein [Suttonella ornithocola]